MRNSGLLSVHDKQPELHQLNRNLVKFINRQSPFSMPVSTISDAAMVLMQRRVSHLCLQLLLLQSLVGVSV
jgi:hypothetical protein